MSEYDYLSPSAKSAVEKAQEEAKKARSELQGLVSQFKPVGQPPRAYLRFYFFVRKHRGWGAAICWYVWMPVARSWGVDWGIACKTITEAKALRRFLNSKVSRYGSQFGVPFEHVAQVAKGCGERVIG